MGYNNKTNDTKAKGFKSLKTTIALLCNSVALVTIVLSIIMYTTNYSNNVKKQIKNNIENLSNAYGLLVDTEISNSKDKIDYEKLLKKIEIQGLESSYGYLTDKDGTMLYHPNKKKIGEPVENSVVRGLVKELKKGNVPENKIVEYEYKGEIKYAGYYISPINKDILIVTADESEIETPITNFILVLIGIEIIILVISSIIVRLFTKKIIKPIKKLKEAVDKTAQFNFEHCNGIGIVYCRKDEIGQIGRAIQIMRSNFRDILQKIDTVAQTFFNSSFELKEVTNNVNENSTDNSATTEELSAGMEETVLATNQIDQNVACIKESVNDINGLTDECLNVSEEILVRAEKIKDRIILAKEGTNKICIEIKDKTEMAIEQAKAVNKINELANAIMEVTEQTSLLALNASIEAARAGDSGKGFAVVANEISNLANQSSETVKGITEIVTEVHGAVQTMTDCMKQTLDFLNNNINNDYKNFTEFGNKYKDDADLVKSNTNNINIEISQLSNTINHISDAINGMNNTIANSSKGIRNIAEKTCDIVSLTSKTYDSVEESVVLAKQLKEIVEKFTL